MNKSKKFTMSERLRRQSLFAFFASILLVSFAACSDDDTNGGGTGAPYNPNEPVKLNTFYPDSGGMATKIILTGGNFGTKKEDVRVWFNNKRAAVVLAGGDKIYAITPRQPGDKCTISVAIGAGSELGKDSVVYDQTFEYTTVITVSTICGKGPRDNKTIVDGTLSEAEMHDCGYLCVDAEKNIFVSERDGQAVRFVNEKSNMVMTLVKGSICNLPNASSTDPDGRAVFVVLDEASAGILEFNPETDWAPKRIKPRPQPGETYLSGQTWLHAIAPNEMDGMMYTRTYHGALFKFDPKSKEAFLIANNVESQTDSFLCFHPTRKNELYIIFRSLHKIMIYDLDKDPSVALRHYAGSELGQGGYGWEDGPVEDALFNQPCQACFDKEGNMYIGDSENHCIRMISPDGIVSTLIGIAGTPGYIDGSPEDALFKYPRGVAIDKDGIVYVGDYGNQVLRKLSVE